MTTVELTDLDLDILMASIVASKCSRDVSDLKTEIDELEERLGRVRILRDRSAGWPTMEALCRLYGNGALERNDGPHG